MKNIRKKLLLFDLGDVIWDECPAILNIAKASLRHLSGLGIHRTYSDWLDCYLRASKNKKVGNRTFHTICCLSSDQSIANTISCLLRDELNDMSVTQMSKLHPLRENVHEVLNRLKRYYFLGILSNHSKSIFRLVRHYRVDRLFDKILISDVVGYRKPDIRFYQYAIKCFGVESYNAVMIGNRLENDIAPAKQCGCHTILFECKKSVVKERNTMRTITPDGYASNFNKLEGAIHKIMRH